MTQYYDDLINSTEFHNKRISHWLTLLGLSNDNTIVIPPMHNHSMANTEDYAHTIVDYVSQKNNNNLKILIALPDEGFVAFYFTFIDIIARRLISEYNFSKSNILYLTGAANTKSNQQKYDKYCAEMNYFPVSVYYINQFECNASNSGRDREFYHNTEPKRDKKFICFNKQPRSHRLQILSNIVKRNLRDKCHLSFYYKYKSLRLSKLDLLYPDSDLSVDKLRIKRMKYEFPIKLTMQVNESNMHNLNQDDEYLFKSALFSLVTETLFNNSVDYKNPDIHDYIHCFPCAFHSEKIWNVIRAKHPFIVVSTPHFLSSLRDLGYKTFHPYINENYDMIEDDQLRITAIMDEVERLCNMSDTETRLWLTNVQAITKHNYNLLMSRNTNTVGKQD